MINGLHLFSLPRCEKYININIYMVRVSLGLKKKWFRKLHETLFLGVKKRKEKKYLEIGRNVKSSRTFSEYLIPKRSHLITTN